jgi:hypothetical protein
MVWNVIRLIARNDVFETIRKDHEQCAGDDMAPWNIDPIACPRQMHEK